MRQVVCLLIMVSLSIAQDTLFITTGVSYIGEIENNTDTHVYFKAENSKTAQPVSRTMIHRIGSYDRATATVNIPENVDLVIQDNQGSMVSGEVPHDSHFSQGTLSVGSLFSYSSAKSSSRDDGNSISTLGSQLNFFSISLKPTLSYFVIDDISLDVLASFTKMLDGEYQDSYKLLGGGGSFYARGIYLGAGYAILMSGDHDYKSTSDFIEVHGGYLHKLVNHVFLDIGASYMSGLNSTSEYDGESHSRDNESTMFRIDVGVKAFFELP